MNYTEHHNAILARCAAHSTAAVASAIIQHTTKDELFELAEEFVALKGANYENFLHSEKCGDGLLPWVVRALVIDLSMPFGAFMSGGLVPTVEYAAACADTTAKVLAHFGIAPDAVPPVLLVREALALYCRLKVVRGQVAKQLPESPHLQRALNVLHGGMLKVPNDDPAEATVLDRKVALGIWKDMLAAVND